VAGQRGDDQVEGVRRATAVLRGVGERLDDLQLLEDRAGPPVRDDQRQRVLMLGADVDEVNVQPVDLGDELRQGVASIVALTARGSRPGKSLAGTLASLGVRRRRSARFEALHSDHAHARSSLAELLRRLIGR
jgi:hypothetical protein